MNLNTLYIQEGKLGRAFRQSSVRRNTKVQQKWLDGMYRSHWIYRFKYIDDGSYFEIEVDYRDKIINVNKNL